VKVNPEQARAADAAAAEALGAQLIPIKTVPVHVNDAPEAVTFSRARQITRDVSRDTTTMAGELIEAMKELENGNFSFAEKVLGAVIEDLPKIQKQLEMAKWYVKATV